MGLSFECLCHVIDNFIQKRRSQGESMGQICYSDYFDAYKNRLFAAWERAQQKKITKKVAKVICTNEPVTFDDLSQKYCSSSQSYMSEHLSMSLMKGCWDVAVYLQGQRRILTCEVLTLQVSFNVAIVCNVRRNVHLTCKLTDATASLRSMTIKGLFIVIDSVQVNMLHWCRSVLSREQMTYISRSRDTACGEFGSNIDSSTVQLCARHICSLLVRKKSVSIVVRERFSPLRDNSCTGSLLLLFVSSCIRQNGSNIELIWLIEQPQPYFVHCRRIIHVVCSCTKGRLHQRWITKPSVKNEVIQWSAKQDDASAIRKWRNFLQTVV